MGFPTKLKEREVCILILVPGFEFWVILPTMWANDPSTAKQSLPQPPSGMTEYSILNITSLIVI